MRECFLSTADGKRLEAEHVEDIHQIRPRVRFVLNDQNSWAGIIHDGLSTRTIISVPR